MNYLESVSTTTCTQTEDTGNAITGKTANTNTTSKATLTLLSKDILCEKLYKDLKEFCSKDELINPDIFLTTYLTFCSHFISNRVQIQCGDRKPIHSNQMATIVANSGKGKGYVFDFFYKPLLKIQNRIIERDKAHNKFVNACKAFLNKNEGATEEEKEKFAKAYYHKYKMDNADKATFELTETIPEIFTVTSFTPESLAVNFSQSKNNSILLCFNEFEDLKENICRTGTIENIYSFIIEYVDGKSEVITRKTKETITTDDVRLSLIVGTTPDNFEALKLTKLYSSGLGYRGQFLIINGINIDNPDKVKKSENGISIYDEYKAKFALIFETFFFNMVYSFVPENYNIPVNNMVTLKVNDEANLKVYNDCIQWLWNEFIKDNDDLTDLQKETFKNRLHTKFMKDILNNYIMNYSYSDGSMFPMHGKFTIDLAELDILRGYNTTRVYLSEQTNVFSTQERSDLTPKQQKVIELLETGAQTPLKELQKRALERGIIAKTAFYDLIKRKSNQFSVYNNLKYGKLITRNF